jgi:phage terminase large subunit
MIKTVKQFAPLHITTHPAYNNRYQIYYGGRGGRKSWEIARGVLVRAMASKKLVVCTREIQHSISDSVHRLLSDQIRMLGFDDFFQVQRNTIKAINGSEFIFKGLNTITVDALKSLEGADICWVEEAHTVSDKSWQILIPTIRKQGSQIIASFNPDLPTDPVLKRFIDNTPPNTYTAKVSYLDNPDCPDTLIQEANYLREVDYDAFSHIWLGEVRAHSEAQVFKGKYKIESFNRDESFGYPLDGCDWGFANDPTTRTRCYIKENKLYVRYEAYKVGCEVNDLPALFDRIPEGKKYPIKADNARPELISYMSNRDYNIKEADKWPGCAQDRVDFMRSFEQIIIHPDCPHAAEEMRLYSYKVDKRTGDILPELRKKHDHILDAIGYSLTDMIRRRTNEGLSPAELGRMFY